LAVQSVAGKAWRWAAPMVASKDVPTADA
jgi:hypothetical protein